MSGFACYWPWLAGGAALGWLLWQLFDRFFRRDGDAAGIHHKRELDAAMSSAALLKSELNGANGKLTNLKADLEKMSGALKLKTDEFASLSTELSEWKVRHADVEGKVKSAATTAVSATAAAAAVAAATLKSSEDKYFNSQREMESVQKTLKGKAEDAVRLAKELDEWKAKHADVDGKAKSAATTAVAAAVAAAAAAAATLKGAEDRYGKLQAEFGGMEKALKTKTDDATRLARELDEWKAKHAEVDGKAKAAATAEAGSLKTANDKFGTLQGEFAGLQQSLKVKTDDAARLSAELDEWKRKHSTAISEHETKSRSFMSDHDTTRQSLKARGEDVERLNAELADWKFRFAALETQSKQSLSAASAIAAAVGFGFKPQKNGRDDLTIVEGIGPKINDLLIADGIDTFAKLAAAPVARVQAILDAAGPSFRLAKPESWAHQSELCMRGEWEALRSLQDRLKAGVSPTDSAEGRP